MCAGVEENDAVVWSVANRLLHASKIEAFCFFREVWVSCDWEGDIGEDLVVVGPGGVAEVDGGVAWIEAFEEESSKMDSSCARNGLYRACAFICKSWGVGAQNEFCGGGCEGCKTSDGEVFVIQGGVVSEKLICLVQ